MSITHRKVSSGTVNASVEVDLYDWNDTHVGLENVDNTSDADKPVSTATQTALDLKQNLDATLTALAGAASAANKLPYFSGVDTVALADFTAAGRALIDDATAAAQRTTLGVSAAVPGETTLEEYGGAGDGTTDNVAAITAIHTAGIQTIRLGAGKVYKFASAIPTITYGMSIIGDTMSSSVLDFYQTTGSCIYYTGTAGGGGRLEGFSIRNKGAATLTAAIKLEAQSGGGSPDYCLVNNVNVTGATNSDLYQYGILLDGSARTSGTVGIRNITLDNVKTFNTTVNSFEVRYGKDIQIDGSFFATGTGGVNSGKITGGSGTESNIVRLDADMGDLALDYCINVLADGVFNAVTATANTSYFNIFGKAVSATINASSTYGRLALQQGATITNNSTTTFVMDRSGVLLDASAAINFSAGDVTIQHATNALTITGASNGLFTEYLIAPSVSDGAALGSATYMWSDGFFASGAALNFNNGDVTLQHAANALTVTGATNGFFSENLIAPSTTDGAALGSTTYMWSDLFLASGGILNWNNADVRIIHAANALTFDGASNGYFFTHLIAPSASDGAAIGSTTYMWSDLFLASGGVINWNNGDVTATHSANLLSFAGASSGYTFDAAVTATGGIVGTTTNDSASAGIVGEYKESKATKGTNTVTITNASPAVISWGSHGLNVASPVNFTTTGGLPTGLSVGTNYYVSAEGLAANTFSVSTSVDNAIAGTSVNTSSAGSGTHTGVATVIFATGTPINVTGMSLTAGDWDVDFVFDSTGGATTILQAMLASISQTSGTLDLTNGRFSGLYTGPSTAIYNGFTNSAFPTLGVLPVRFSLASTTTLYAVAATQFTTSTSSGFGFLRARRVR